MTTGGRIVGVAGIDPAFEKKRRDGKAFAIAGAIIMLALSGLLWAFSRNAMGDFKVVYYSARTFLQHGNPYNEQDVLRVYQAEGRERPDEIAENRAVFTRFIYMPPTFVVTLPIAAAGFTAGQFIWAALEAASLLLAAWAVWDLSYKAAPLPAGGLIGLLLSGSFWMLMMGNSAAISVGLCIFGIWSFLRERNIVAGVLCMAISLALKPHDAGPVWLFLLVTGPTLRRRAWQALFAAAAIGLPWLIYAQLFFLHWFEQVRNNLMFLGRPGGIADSGPAGFVGKVMDPMVQLQVAVRLFCTDARLANLMVYLICGALFVAWFLIALYVRHRSDAQYIVLAAIIPLAMLPLYHFQHDAKLLLLTIPACAVLSRDRFMGKSAILLTGLTIVSNSDILTFVQAMYLRGYAVPESGLHSAILSLIFTRTGTVTLLILTLFFLIAAFEYVRRTGADAHEADASAAY